jgi:hypothetical protein
MNVKKSKKSEAKQGARNPNARLTPDQVKKIRRAVARYGSERGYKAALAREYGISQGTLADIVSGRRWGHI